MVRRWLPNVYEGWIVVGSSAFIVTMIGASFFYGFGTIFNPLRDEFGWSSAATSLAFSLRQETSGIAAPFIGMTIDRVGPRRVLLFGLAMVSIGVIGMSFMQNLFQFYVAMFVIAIGTSSAGGQVGLVAIATWFEARRARAMSFMTIGGGVAGIFVVFVALLVEALGWRGALRTMAGVIIVVGTLAALNVRARPARHHQPMDGIRRADYREDDEELPDWGVPIRRAVTSRAFLLVALALVANGFATTAIIVHQIPFLESIGVSSGLAGASVAVFTTTSIVGRLGAGFLADKYDKRIVLAGSIGLAGLGLPLLAIAGNFWTAVLALLIIAPGFGGAIPVRPALLADYFGTKYFGTLNGILMLLATFGSFGGPLLVGWLFDRTGDYTASWLVCGAVGLLAVPVALAATAPRALTEEYRTIPGPPTAGTSAAG
ncbi:MAG: MFS transporter [Dehalococcoidia bacterium]